MRSAFTMATLRACIGCRLPASPGHMPYGVVMATAGAGAMAGLCHWHGLKAALTAVALCLAVGIAMRGAAAFACHGRFSDCRCGLFTIPLGLAVTGQNLQALASTAGNVF